MQRSDFSHTHALKLCITRILMLRNSLKNAIVENLAKHTCKDRTLSIKAAVSSLMFFPHGRRTFEKCEWQQKESGKNGRISEEKEGDGTSTSGIRL